MKIIKSSKPYALLTNLGRHCWEFHSNWTDRETAAAYADVFLKDTRTAIISRAHYALMLERDSMCVECLGAGEIVDGGVALLCDCQRQDEVNAHE